LLGFAKALTSLMIPVWSNLKTVAHALHYDGAITRESQRGKPLLACPWVSVTIAALVLVRIDRR
jgi:hypothetical protein